MKTNYSVAWHEWRKTPEYKSLADNLKSKGIKYPYRANILQVAFNAGWGNKKIFETSKGGK